MTSVESVREVKNPQNSVYVVYERPLRKRAFEWFPCNSNAFQKDAVACLHNAFQTKQLK